MPLTKLWSSHTNQPEPFDVILDQARRELLHLPYPFVKAIVSGILDRQRAVPPGTISVTDVIGCPRAKSIKEAEEYYEHLEDLIAAFRGQLLHQLLAWFSQDEAIVETRTSREFQGYTLSGTADSILTTRANGMFKVYDFKTTKKIPQWSPWSIHQQQLNIYRWLYEIPVNEAELTVFYFDLNGGEIAERKIKRQQMWTDEKVEGFLTERFLPIARALETKTIVPFRAVPAEVLSWACGWCPVFESCYNKLLDEPGALPIFHQAARDRGDKKKSGTS